MSDTERGEGRAAARRQVTYALKPRILRAPACASESESPRRRPDQAKRLDFDIDPPEGV